MTITSNVFNTTRKGGTVSDLASPIAVADGGTGATALVNALQVYHGVQSIGAVSFNNSEKVLNIGSTTVYWYKGVKVTTAALTCDLDLDADRDHATASLTTNTLYYFYFKDATGKLYWSPTAWDLKEVVPVATVFWNGSAGAPHKEWHNHTRDLDWHINAHLTIGARYLSGLDLTKPTTALDANLDLTAGYIYDEDLPFVIANQTTARAWYKASVGAYTFADIALPYTGTSGDCSYLNTGTYTLTSATASKYVCYWVYGSGDIDKPIYIIPTHAAAPYNTVALARAETVPSLSGFGLNPELKLLYRFIYRGDGEFQEAADYRLSSSLPIGSVPSVAAASVTFAPAGNVAATNVQAAIEELDVEKVPWVQGTGVLATPVISKGPAIINSGFAGTVTATASTTVVFSSAADAILAGYHATAPVLGVTLISNSLTRDIQSWTNSTTAVVNAAVTWAGTAITSVQHPIAVFVDSTGVVCGYINGTNKILVLTSAGLKLGVRDGGGGGLTLSSNNLYFKGLVPDASGSFIIANSNGLDIISSRGDGQVTMPNGNILIGGATAAGTSAAKVLGIGEGTAPTTSPANMSQLWSADIGGVAAKNAFHMRDEEGNSGPVAFRNILEVVVASSATMGLNNVYGKRHTNYGQTADAVLTFVAGAAGYSGEISMATTVAKYYRLTPPTGAAFMLDGSVLAANQSVQVASAAEGNRIDWDTVQIGAAEWRIRLWNRISGTWAAV